MFRHIRLANKKIQKFQKLENYPLNHQHDFLRYRHEVRSEADDLCICDNDQKVTYLHLTRSSESAQLNPTPKFPAMLFKKQDDRQQLYNLFEVQGGNLRDGIFSNNAKPWSNVT